MTTKTFCDVCGKEIVKPVPYKLRFKRDVEYRTKTGVVKYRKVLVSLDFDSADCMLKYVQDNVKILKSADII